MDPQTAQVAQRIAELKALIASNKQALSDIDTKTATEATAYTAALEAKYAEADVALAEAKARWADDHTADLELTAHFSDSANRVALDTLQARQDEGIQKERAALHQTLAKAAQKELTARATLLTSAYDDELARTLQRDADAHAKQLEQLIVNHNDEVFKLTAQLPPK